MALPRWRTQSSRRVLSLGLLLLTIIACTSAQATRERISINAGWRFSRFTTNPDQLSYDTLKSWILPSANDFITRTKYKRPSGTPPGSDVQYVQDSFDDSTWDAVDVPHDWAIKGPFGAPGISGGEGKLPYNGVGWYRRKITVEAADVAAKRNLYLDVGGAMSYASVWLNGVLVGGWPYGYNGFRLDLTPYAKAGDNILAIRLENAPNSSRWYPGAGLYRNVWLIKVSPVHVAQYGTKITTPSVSAQKATVAVSVTLENNSNNTEQVDLVTEIFELDPATRKAVGDAKAKISRVSVDVAGGAEKTVNSTVDVPNPKLWGPPPKQTPNEYVAISTLYVSGNKTIDTYETPFGIRTIIYDANKGLVVNGIGEYVKGVCNHHDLGSLGSAFNVRAAERQLQTLQEMGTNGLRTSHNMPASELLDLTDRLGVMVMGETFDTWKRQKVANDYHLLFDDWHEADMRAYVRRERNHPSIVAWSIGNEVPDQQYAEGGTYAKELQDVANEEDGTRQSTSGLNSADPNKAISNVLEIIGLNYQGEGHGTDTSSTYPNFHSKFPNKMLWTTESASTVSTRGTYIFPVTPNITAVVSSSAGENTTAKYVSSYELYSPSWASSPDKVFVQQDKFPYAAGEFVWTGWDYLGEPTPFDSASRSSYFGIIDLAGFKKDRFWLYQARWRPDIAQAHILPHWTWPSSRVGQVTPVHVFTSGDEAELFVNGKSAGRKKLAQSQYRVRWDNVTYQPGDLKVVAYKGGAKWAEDSRRTVGAPAKLNVTADRTTIRNDGYDLSFVTVAVVDDKGDVVPEASNGVAFSISGPGEIVSTDNGDPTDMTAFPSTSRKAFSGLALAVVRSKKAAAGSITVSAASGGLASGQVVVQAG
ncbi:glycoside hydrolase family 2 protein [Lophiostoma macrostomum CBS 122681]|uniref:Glycoside hydrolase family 2 protein n=1 Tax=Lophiostoma macrostomum CBS 122681 TaxID=1314788 RepID=A0A6A6SKQ4_9PLEO|nr:glycoside hydrolase family 2 protein [Lophiostoma macrostomum CBS 122681]